MIESRKKKPQPKDRIEDEPGAEDRFRQLVKRALSRPPQHRKTAPKRSVRAKS